MEEGGWGLEEDPRRGFPVMLSAIAPEGPTSGGARWRPAADCPLGARPGGSEVFGLLLRWEIPVWSQRWTIFPHAPKFSLVPMCLLMMDMKLCLE